MEVSALSDALGVEVRGLDLRRPLPETQIELLRRLHREAGLLCFRGQDLSPADQVRAVSHFGPLSLNDDGSPWRHVSNVDVGGAGDFVSESRLLMHSDLQFAPQPLQGISLYGVEVDEGSAPTVFANAARAYAVLPQRLKDRIAGLCVLNAADYRPDGAYDYRPDRAQLGPEVSRRDFPRTVHPLVYRRPGDERPVLFACEGQSSFVVGLPQDESEALLGELFAALYAPDNRYVHDWRNGDLLVWDNVALQHGRPETPRSARRVLRRVVLSTATQGYLTEAAMT